MNGAETFFYYADRLFLVVMIGLLAFTVYKGRQENERENAYHGRLTFVTGGVFLALSSLVEASWMRGIFLLLVFTSFFAMLVLGTRHLKK